jgi:hypothetical protein
LKLRRRQHGSFAEAFKVCFCSFSRTLRGAEGWDHGPCSRGIDSPCGNSMLVGSHWQSTIEFYLVLGMTIMWQLSIDMRCTLNRCRLCRFARREVDRWAIWGDVPQRQAVFRGVRKETLPPCWQGFCPRITVWKAASSLINSQKRRVERGLPSRRQGALRLVTKLHSPAEGRRTRGM